MRKVIFFLFLSILLVYNSNAQQGQYLGSPTTKVIARGEFQVDSLFVLPNRTDTNFIPSKPGAIVFRTADRRNYYYDGVKWRQMSDNTNPVWVDTLYSVNDSTLRWSKNGQNFNLVIKGGSRAAPSFSGTVINDSILALNYNGVWQQFVIRGSNAYSQKLDSISKSNDSVYFYKNGVKTFAYLDQGGTGTSETASNVGTGIQVFKSKVGNDLQFRTLTSGNSNIAFTQNSNDIVITGKSFVDSLKRRSDSVFFYKNGAETFAFKDSVGAGGGSGETNTASNVGTGAGIFKEKSSADLVFKSIVADFGIVVTPNTNDLTIKVDTSLDIATKTMVNAKTFYANSVADLKTKNPNNGSFAITLGYYNPNDGGSAKYRWNSSSTATADDVLVVAATGITTGRWELLVDNGH
jgi:hypothetical protein